jgi:uncharacterized protein YkwD
MNRIPRALLGLALVASVSLAAWAQTGPKKDEGIKAPIAEAGKGKDEIRLVAAELLAPGKLNRQEEGMLTLLNRLRTNNKLGAVEINWALVRAARANSTEMAMKSMVDREVGQKKVDKIVVVAFTKGIGGALEEEKPRTNKVAAWTEGYYPLQGVIDTWMDEKLSPKSRERLLTPETKQVGIGIVRTTRNEFYYTVLYAEK